jgi:hypothetical protein
LVTVLSEFERELRALAGGAPCSDPVRVQAVRPVCKAGLMADGSDVKRKAIVEAG